MAQASYAARHHVRTAVCASPGRFCIDCIVRNGIIVHLEIRVLSFGGTG